MSTSGPDRPVVFATRALPVPGVQPLVDAGLDVRVQAVDRVATRDELLAGVADADALVCLLADRIDDEVLAAGPRLRVVANFAVGYENVDLAAAARRGIVVTNTPGVLTDATADLTIGLLLAATRRIVEGDRLVRSGGWTGWAPDQLLGTSLQGAVLGIVGMGAIGTAVARRARGFGMEVRYHNRHRRPEAEVELGARWCELDELLAASDVLTLHAPLSPETRHLLDRDRLFRCKAGAVLVNTGRGALIDEAALVDALRHGPLAAAGLDVYEFEPRVTAGLLELPNVVLAPHLGSATASTRAAMAELVCANVLAVLRGGVPPTPVG